MNQIHRTLYGLETTIDRPNAIIVTNGIKRLLGISNKEVYTTYTIDDTTYRRKTNTAKVQGQSNTYNEYMSITYKEVSQDRQDVSLLIYNPFFTPVYRDKSIETIIKPLYHKRMVTMAVRYGSKSKSYIIGLINRLRLTTAREFFYTYHDLEYSYILEGDTLLLLMEILERKNKYDNTKLTLEEYFNKYFDKRLIVNYSHTGDLHKAEYLVRETQLGIAGFINEDMHTIEEQYDENLNLYYIEFTYSFRYDKPVSLEVKYPSIVYNQPLPLKFTKSIAPSGWAEIGDGVNPIRIEEILYNVRLDGKTYVTIPRNDEPIRTPLPVYYSRVFTSLIIVEPENRYTLFNLNEIPCIRIRKCVYDCMVKSTSTDISKRRKHLVYIQLFENDNKVQDGQIYVDALGNLKTTFELDITKLYRLSFNIMHDLTYLDTDGETNLKNCGNQEDPLGMVKCVLHMLGKTDDEIALILEKCPNQDITCLCSFLRCAEYRWFLVQVASTIILNMLEGKIK